MHTTEKSSSKSISKHQHTTKLLVHRFSLCLELPSVQVYSLILSASIEGAEPFLMIIFAGLLTASYLFGFSAYKVIVRNHIFNNLQLPGRRNLQIKPASTVISPHVHEESALHLLPWAIVHYLQLLADATSEHSPQSTIHERRISSRRRSCRSLRLRYHLVNHEFIKELSSDPGTYYLSGTSTAKSAFAIEEGKERIVVICSNSHRLLVDDTQ